jgi:hypothetical protein
MYKRSVFAVVAIVMSITTVMTGGLYMILADEPLEIKTNSIKTIVTTKKHIASNLWKAATIYFWNSYLPTWEKGIEPTRAEKKRFKKLLHYNPFIEYIVEHDQDQHVDHKRPTIYFHGWGDTKNSAKLLKAYADVLPGDLITFHFRDRGVILPKLRHANLGQLPDVLSALVAMKWAKDTLKLSAIDLYGYSRGAATILNSIAVLNDKTELYDDELARIGINKDERAALLAMIQNGSIVLDAPLVDMNSSIKERVKDFSKTAITMLTRVTKYQPYGLQGLSSAELFEGLKLNILLHYQYHDTIGSNKHDAALYQALFQHNPRTTYVVLGNDGGHLHTHASLAHAIHTFRKMFGGSYDKIYDYQYHQTRSRDQVEGVLLQPGRSIESVIENYYNDCKELCKK